MIRTLFITCILYIMSIGLNALAQESYRTKIMRDDIKSLEIKVEGKLVSTPFIELNGEQRIEITFDALFHTTGRFAYSVIHCDGGWTKSRLLPIEYMKGFQNETIKDYAMAIGTTTSYVNYKIVFPSEDTQFTVSGNYVIQVYEEDRPGKIVLTACFSIVESLVEINASVSGNTDIDFNREHQQVEFIINPKGLNLLYPQTDLKVFVYQNHNLNDVRANIQPLMIINRQLHYRNNRDLIFEAGNEFRRIEFLTHRISGMGVESTGFFNPYYHMTLYKDRKRNRSPYLYDQDQNGRFFINCAGCKDPDTEGDYYVVHFSLASEQIPNGTMHLFGDLFNNSLDSQSQMDYNPQTEAYEKAILLKTGLYNYHYAFKEEGGTKPSFRQTEGNFFETENEYTIAVYFCPMGARYDRLIGYQTINSR